MSAVVWTWKGVPREKERMLTGHFLRPGTILATMCIILFNYPKYLWGFIPDTTSRAHIWVHSTNTPVPIYLMGSSGSCQKNIQHMEIRHTGGQHILSASWWEKATEGLFRTVVPVHCKSHWPTCGYWVPETWWSELRCAVSMQVTLDAQVLTLAKLEPINTFYVECMLKW